MTFKQFFGIPVFISILAVTLVMLDGVIPATKIPFLWTWITFQAWATYFLAGCNVKGGVKVMAGYLGGAVASVAIMELMGLLAPSLGNPAALAVAVFIVVLGVISAERVPWFDFVPAWFIGAGVFFGVMNLNTTWQWGGETAWSKYLEAGTFLMVSCLVGQIYGWVTVFCRVKYEACVKGETGEAEAPEPETAAAEE